MEFDEKYSYSLMFSEPIVFKQYLSVCPIFFGQYHLYKAGIASLLYAPLSYPDAALSVLPRLYFLTNILNYQNDITYLTAHQDLLRLFESLKIILTLSLKDQPCTFVKTGAHWFLRVQPTEEMQKSEGCPPHIDIRGKDFDALREIILNQNGVEYSDEFLHEDVRRRMAEDEKLLGPQEVITDEACMEGVMLDLGICDEQELKKLSMRRYNRLAEKVIARESYNNQAVAAMSGWVKFESQPRHWLAPADKHARLARHFVKART